MLFVKTKEQEKDHEVIFEVITRSPFNNIDFKMEKEMFRNLFKCSDKAMINTNVSNGKSDIFECIDETFVTKLYWWNSNMVTITDLYEKVYDVKKYDMQKRLELDDYAENYALATSCDNFVFLKDFRFFETLFDTAKELSLEN